MITWLVPRQDLTPDQARVVELLPTINRVVLGMAGSGKTQVLVHRAAHLAETYRIPPERFRVFVFTNVIKEYIRSGLEFLKLPDGVVSTFDFWCVDLFEKHFGARLPRKPNGRDIDFPAIRRRVLGLVRGKSDLQNSLEFVLVDEGQDLSPEAYEIIFEAARHVTVFADPQQKIFEDGAEAGFIFDRLHVTTPQITILGAFRNAVYVAELAAHFIEDGQKRAQFLAQVSAAQRVKERPLCYVADSFDKEMDRLAEVIRARQVLNERIGIIVPTNRLVHGLADGLCERGVMVEKAVTKEKAGKVEVTCAFNNLVPKIATFFMAKGLTFDSVLLPRLTAKAYDWTRREQLKRMMFVGIARATQWVYLSTVKGTEFNEMAVLREAAAQGHLTMQEGIGDRKPGPGGKGGGQEREQDDYSVL
ncbi:MAG: UvrD-helicase domain-containing protein [Planctomycetes bacterium]|nr:UvrD-helicase domain-containing protein [Planctomycetota bacterium]